jgi:TonB family protein
MEQLFPFIVSNIFLMVFYGIYHVFLKNETFHHANRFYLIASSFLAITIPWIEFSAIYAWFAPIVDEKNLQVIVAKELEIIVKRPQSFFSFLSLKKVYLGITFIFLIRSFVFFLKCFYLKSNSVFISNNAFSFFGHIYVDTKLNNYSTLIEHEETHKKQKHFLDLLFFESLKALFWINPASYWLNKNIRVVHEFLADEEASQTMPSKYQYSLMLMSRHFGIDTQNPFVQSFFKKSTIKHRIQMLSKDPSQGSAQLKYILTVPVLIVLLFASSFTWIKAIPQKVRNIAVMMEPVAFNNTDNKKIKTPFIKDGVLYEQDTLKPDDHNISEVFTTAEQIPEFPGGLRELYKFLGENIIYPKEAQINNISGRVFLKFIIKKDGSIGDINVLKGIGFGCDEEAVRVIKMLPNWKPALQNGHPVNIYYNMPVVFKLDIDDDGSSNLGKNYDNNSLDKFAQRDKPFELKIAGNDYNDALIYVNDVEILNKKINDLDPASIESVSVIKGNTAVLTYGERAKNGVILIKTKK